MIKQLPELDFLLVPVGGGGLISGCSIVNSAITPRTKIIGVESKLYPSLYNSLKNKKIKMWWFNNSRRYCS